MMKNKHKNRFSKFTTKKFKLSEVKKMQHDYSSNYNTNRVCPICGKDVLQFDTNHTYIDKRYMHYECARKHLGV